MNLDHLDKQVIIILIGKIIITRISVWAHTRVYTCMHACLCKKVFKSYLNLQSL